MTPEQITVPRETWDAMLEALLKVAHMAEALKRDCGMDPESKQAIRNGEYMNISYVAREALTAAKAVSVEPLSKQLEGKDYPADWLEFADKMQAAKAVSHPKPETTPAPEAGAITFENDDADMLTIAYMDGFDAGKKSVQPQACDMGAMCLDCQPRGKHGECPDQSPQASEPAPAGWKLVPIRPTVEMLDAADASDREYSLRAFGAGIHMCQSGEDHGAAMLAAAPEAP